MADPRAVTDLYRRLYAIPADPRDPGVLTRHVAPPRDTAPPLPALRPPPRRILRSTPAERAARARAYSALLVAHTAHGPAALELSAALDRLSDAASHAA